MATTAGALSQVSVGQTTASLLSAAATGGTAPYTYQWYRSTVSGFTPGGGNILADETALTLNDTGLTPGTKYFYKVVATDAGPVSGTSAQLEVNTSAQELQINQFAQQPFLGTMDMKFNSNTVSVEIDASETGSLIAGQAVKMVDSAGGVPKVIACSANADGCLGFLAYDIKTKAYVAGDRAEIGMKDNCMYLFATTAIARGARVQLDVATKGGVAALVGSSGASIVGWAYDKAPVSGQLIRVMLLTPSFQVA